MESIRIRLMSAARVKAEDFHKSQSGAVALACLAALMIIFMSALILYDAGQIARDKIDVQNAADTSAYSASALKARTMNMIAYTNVAKRSVVGMHNIYWGAYQAYIEWWAGRCSSCGPFNPGACIDCIINAPLVIVETVTDTLKYLIDTFGQYAADIAALEAYQVYMSALTPWWSWSEATVRAARNGGTVASTFPPPPGLLLTKIIDWVSMGMQLLGLGKPYNHSYEVDGMPTTKLSFAAAGMCAPFLTSVIGALEYQANVMIHQSRSQLGASKASVVYKGAYIYGPTIGCLLSFIGFGVAMFPHAPNAGSNNPGDLMAKSEITIAYKHEPDNENLRNKYSFMKQEYINGDAGNAAFAPTGHWALSRGEFFTPGEVDPSPWVAEWTAKLRPFTLPGEQASLGYDVNAMYHDVAPYLGLTAILGVLTQKGATSWSGAMDDAGAMEKMTRSMGNSTIDGYVK